MGAGNPTSDNKIADFVNGLVNALMSGGVTAAQTYLTATSPIFAYPFINWLSNIALNYLAGIIGTAVKNALDTIVIDIQTNGEASSVIQTATALAIAQASGDVNAITQAKHAAIDAWAALIHSDGWAHPSP